jgi:hypothetical protein
MSLHFKTFFRSLGMFYFSGYFIVTFEELIPAEERNLFSTTPRHPRGLFKKSIYCTDGRLLLFLIWFSFVLFSLRKEEEGITFNISSSWVAYRRLAANCRILKMDQFNIEKKKKSCNEQAATFFKNIFLFLICLFPRDVVLYAYLLLKTYRTEYGGLFLFGCKTFNQTRKVFLNKKKRKSTNLSSII